MLGWFSSIVLRRNEFVASMNDLREIHHCTYSDTLEGRSKYSAFAHSAAIYKQCVGKKSLFVDLPLADPQERKQTEETSKRWAVENTPERYLFVADDLQRLKEMGLIKKKCSKMFFRYASVNFWDLWLSYLMSLLIDIEKTEVELSSKKFLAEWSINLDRIMKVTELLNDPNDIKQLSYMHLSLKYMAGYLSSVKFFDRAAMDAISEQIQALIVPSYNFSFVHTDE